MKQKISKKKREKNKNLKATVNGKQKIIDGLKKKLSFINENTTNSSEQLHEEIRKKQMVVHPTVSPVRTTSRFILIQINKNNASQIEEETELHKEAITENKQNIVSRPAIITDCYHLTSMATRNKNSTGKQLRQRYRKTYIIDTDTVKGICMKESNKHLENSFAELRLLLRASIKQLQHFAIPTLIDELPNRIILYNACNGVGDRNFTPEHFVKKIEELARMYSSYRVNELFISLLIGRNNKVLNKKLRRMNFLISKKHHGSKNKTSNISNKMSDYDALTNIKLKDPERTIIGQKNVNFPKSKTEIFSEMIKEKLEIFTILETKLDPPFPETQSQIDGYSKPYRRDKIWEE